MPTMTPTSQPTAAMPRLTSAASRHDDAQSGRAPRRAGHGFDERATISHTCGIAWSLVRGSSRTPEPVIPLSADEPAVGRAEELVELPDRGERDDADRAPHHRPRTPRRGARQRVSRPVDRATRRQVAMRRALARSRPARRCPSCLRRDVLGERRDDGLAVHAQRLLLVVVLEVAGELVDAELGAAA